MGQAAQKPMPPDSLPGMCRCCGMDDLCCHRGAVEASAEVDQTGISAMRVLHDGKMVRTGWDLLCNYLL
jgi:hypothetical protein